MRIRPKTSDDNDVNNIFWVTMTDLMTGLVLVFIVLFFYTYMTSHLDKIKQDLAKENATKVFQETLKEKDINATVDPITGVVKISDLELFDVNSYTLSPKGKAYLDKFAPAYINSIFSNESMSKNVAKIIVQGHTDSQTYKGEYSQDQQYMKNMDLSLNRAYAVANYMTNTSYNKTHGDKLRKMIIVEGASFSNPILVNGKEDYAKSRRVELKLIMKNQEG
ncbi:MAG: OmpA family protein [bacterium]|nr:OmpA family protein [bacterium]